VFVSALAIGAASISAAPTVGADITFSGHNEIPAGSGPASIVVGDLNSDGKPDLAVANSRSPGGAVTTLIGDGTGSFGSPTTMTAPLANPNSVSIGDFNRDGRLDLAAVDFWGGTTSNVETYGAVLLGDGAGGFTASPVLVSAGLANPLAVGVADINGDGASDIVTVGAKTSGSNPVGFTAVLRGDGTGAFPTRNFSQGGDVRRSLVLADLNGDSKLDLATADSGREDFPGKAWVGLGDGTGCFGVCGGGSFTADAGVGTTSIARGDFNGDGLSDLVTANYESDDVTVFLGNGTGSLPTGQSFPAHDGPVGVNVGDFDGDGRQDLAVANAVSQDVSVLPGSGTGSFGAPLTFAVGAMFTLEASRYHGDGGRVAVGDFNCNGTDDIAVANGAAGTVSVLLNARPGSKPAGCLPPGSDDTTAPAVKVVSKSLRMTKGGVIALRLRCPASEAEGCRTKVKLATLKKVKFAGASKRVTLGTASKILSAGKTSVVKLKVRGSKRTLVKRLGSVRVKVTAMVFDQAGNAQRTAKTLTLRSR
jgi:hypothetical protein